MNFNLLSETLLFLKHWQITFQKEIESPKNKILQKGFEAFFSQYQLSNFQTDTLSQYSKLTAFWWFLKMLSFKEHDELSGLLVQRDFLSNTIVQNRFTEHWNQVFKGQSFLKTPMDQMQWSIDSMPQIWEYLALLNQQDSIAMDFVGNVYNRFVDADEQHNTGQFFTQIDEIDIILGFCLNQKTSSILDSGCGTGSFILKANQLLPIIESIGIDVASFPILLCVIQNGIFQYANAQFLHQDFLLWHTKNEAQKFDNCIGNPPYIRQELIPQKAAWQKVIKAKYPSFKLNKKSDFYVYYLLLTATHLKEGGRLGYVVASSWLDVKFGVELQAFLLEHFKIIAIVEQQAIRSFDTAAVNTCILILEKCSDSKTCLANSVKFVRLFKPYTIYIDTPENKDRTVKINQFIHDIESNTKSCINEHWQQVVLTQNQLKEAGTIDGLYKNGSWGAKYLRSPLFYTQLIATQQKKETLIPLYKIADIKRGFTTGANAFFYLIEVVQPNEKEIDTQKEGWFYSKLTEKTYRIAREFVKPLLKSQKEAVQLHIELKQLKNVVLLTMTSKEAIFKKSPGLHQYIEDAEALNIHLRPSCASRISATSGRQWFHLAENPFISDFVFPSKIGEYYRLMDNRPTKVVIDKVNYGIRLKEGFKEQGNTIFLLLNSMLFRFLAELFARQLTGAQTLSDVDVHVLSNTLIPNPLLFEFDQVSLEEITISLKNREQASIFKEVLESDRKALDQLILKRVGLEETQVVDLYQAITQIVGNRKQKSASMKTIKSKPKLNMEEAIKLVQQKYPNIRSYQILTKVFETRSVFQISNYTSEHRDLLDFLKEELKIEALNPPLFYYNAKTVLETLQEDFTSFFPKIEQLLKTNRSSESAVSIYRQLILMKNK